MLSAKPMLPVLPVELGASDAIHSSSDDSHLVLHSHPLFSLSSQTRHSGVDDEEHDDEHQEDHDSMDIRRAVVSVGTLSASIIGEPPRSRSADDRPSHRTKSSSSSNLLQVPFHHGNLSSQDQVRFYPLLPSPLLQISFSCLYTHLL